jgi:hypothetical protein
MVPVIKPYFGENTNLPIDYTKELWRIFVWLSSLLFFYSIGKETLRGYSDVSCDAFAVRREGASWDDLLLPLSAMSFVFTRYARRC